MASVAQLHRQSLGTTMRNLHFSSVAIADIFDLYALFLELKISINTLLTTKRHGLTVSWHIFILDYFVLDAFAFVTVSFFAVVFFVDAGAIGALFFDVFGKS